MATTLQLIVPVYNEHENFPRLVEQVEQQLAPPFRMLVVYDFDEDTTVPVARDLAASRPWLELVRNDLGRGPANAIRAGFAAANPGPALVVMADLSDDLSIVPGDARAVSGRQPHRLCIPLHEGGPADRWSLA